MLAAHAVQVQGAPPTRAALLVCMRPAFTQEWEQINKQRPTQCMEGGAWRGAYAASYAVFAEQATYDMMAIATETVMRFNVFISHPSKLFCVEKKDAVALLFAHPPSQPWKLFN